MLNKLAHSYAFCWIGVFALTCVYLTLFPFVCALIQLLLFFPMHPSENHLVRDGAQALAFIIAFGILAIYFVGIGNGWRYLMDRSFKRAWFWIFLPLVPFLLLILPFFLV